MDNKTKSIIDKVIQLSRQNAEFGAELRKRLGMTTSANVIYESSDISNDVSVIREALEIRANKSISYDFVNEQRWRDQLIIDNLRMENAALNLQKNEAERFYTFCVNAFYQLENIVNYYFYITYPRIEDLLSVVELYTQQESSDFQYKRTGTEKNVGDINIVHKLNAICQILFPDNGQLKRRLGKLRQVRNEGEHRCMIVQQEKDETNILYKFFKYNTFNSVRIDLIKIVNAIKIGIGNPIISKTEIKAIISSKLPSACYIKINDKIEKLPDNLFYKVKNIKNGEDITLFVENEKIIDVVT